MKKNIFWIVLLAVSTLISACGDDDGGPDPATAPTVSFTFSQTEYVASPNEQIVVEATATGGSGLSRFELTIAPGEFPSNAEFTQAAPVQSASGEEDDFSFTLDTFGASAVLPGVYTLRITVTDTDNRTASDDIVITIDFPATELSDITLASHLNSQGSFFIIEDRQSGVQDIDYVNTGENYLRIDFAYSFSEEEPEIAASIFSLSDDQLPVLFFAENTSGWPVPKETLFKEATVADYELITEQELIDAYDASINDPSSRIRKLENGSVFFVKQDATENIFIVKVTEIIAGAGGTITFSIKGVF